MRRCFQHSERGKNRPKAAPAQSSEVTDGRPGGFPGKANPKIDCRENDGGDWEAREGLSNRSSLAILLRARPAGRAGLKKTGLVGQGMTKKPGNFRIKYKRRITKNIGLDLYRNQDRNLFGLSKNVSPLPAKT